MIEQAVPHAHAHLYSLILYLAFLIGQGLYILRRAGMAIRSKTNPLSTRREYLFHNWDFLLIRVVLGSVFFIIWRRGSITTALGIIGVTMPDWLSIPQWPPIALLIGFFADAFLDSLSQSSKVPAFLREKIPTVDGNGETPSAAPVVEAPKTGG